MKTLLTITSWIAIIVGILAVIGSLPTAEYYADWYGIIGGLLFTTQGTLTLVYIEENK
jgi:hypothetical protein